MTSNSTTSANQVVADYGLTGSDVYNLQTWILSNTAATAGDYKFNWNYSGDHAYFDVHAELDAIINGVEVGIYNPANENCCNSPSNGFNQSGTYDFGTLQVGDNYGFIMRGSNSDSDDHLYGTLNITDANASVSAVPEPETYAMLLTGLGLMGFMVRRRKSS